MHPSQPLVPVGPTGDHTATVKESKGMPVFGNRCSSNKEAESRARDELGKLLTEEKEVPTGPLAPTFLFKSGFYLTVQCLGRAWIK